MWELRAMSPKVPPSRPTCDELASIPSRSPQLDTSIASPGVMGPSNGVVKPDADVDDGMDTPTVPLISSGVTSGVIFSRKIWLWRWTARCREKTQSLMWVPQRQEREERGCVRTTTSSGHGRGSWSPPGTARL